MAPSPVGKEAGPGGRRLAGVQGCLVGHCPPWGTTDVLQGAL